ncbi:MAG: hypothetical protein L6Q99_19530 [Planctomycetes bacterium]|nr:hypothetical protein [Planctomycetota bacterium]
MLARALLLVLVAVTLVTFGSAQRGSPREEFDRRRTEWRIQASHRHLELALDCRKKGHVKASAKQILIAHELSRGAHPGVTQVHALLQSLDDAFWKKNVDEPSKAEIASYDKQARKLEERDLSERIDFALWALGKGLEEDAHHELLELLRRRDEALVFDERGQLRLGAKKIPVDASARLRAVAIQIDGEWVLRDELLSRLPELETIHQRADERLCVRSTTSDAEAEFVFAVAKAALEPLEAALGGRPERRLHLVLFGDRDLYGKYLDRAGIGQYRVVRGVAERAANAAALLTADISGDELVGLVLHELAHAYDFAVSPCALPEWYSEGFADSFGGRGTFTWRDGRLETGLTFDRGRLERMREKRLPLAEFFRREPLELWRTDPGAAEDFYTQAWALHRFLDGGAAGKDFSERFETWEIECRGRALGADLTRPEKLDPQAAQALFDRRFGADLAELETSFAQWLATL